MMESQSTSLSFTPIRTVERHLLRSDYVLSKREEEHMKELLEEEKHEDERLGKDIVYLGETSEKIERRQQEVRINIQRRQSVLSPLRRVPTEIWEIIFSAVCSSTRDGYSLHIDYLEKVLEMPSVVLSQVCSRWRQITADYPQLWASINITFEDLRDHTKRILQLFLDNSEGCDLNVRLFRQRWADYPLAQVEKDVWELLTRNLWRCRKLSFYAEYSPLFQFPSSSDQQISFPNLMIYEEDAPRPEPHHERYNSGLIAWWKALRDAPKLTRVSTWVFHSPESLSYSQLTVLYVHLYPSEILELLHILPSSIQLEDLTLMHGWASTETHHLTFNPRPVEIPSLQKLVIGGFLIDHNSLREILELLRTPALKTLALHCWGGHAMENGWPSSILSLLERSPMLRDVLLYNDQCEPPTSDPSARPSLVLPLLYAIPNVEVLQLGIDSSEYALHFEEHADPLLSDLLGKLAQVELTPLLPKLVNLSLYMTDITLDTKCVEAILSTATARSPSVLANSGARGLIRPISHLSVLRFRDIATPFMPVDIDADLSARVQGLRNDGVVVDIGKGGHVPTQLVPRTVIEG